MRTLDTEFDAASDPVQQRAAATAQRIVDSSAPAEDVAAEAIASAFARST